MMSSRIALTHLGSSKQASPRTLTHTMRTERLLATEQKVKRLMAQKNKKSSHWAKRHRVFQRGGGVLVGEASPGAWLAESLRLSGAVGWPSVAVFGLQPRDGSCRKQTSSEKQLAQPRRSP